MIEIIREHFWACLFAFVWVVTTIAEAIGEWGKRR
jgi:hypothetical protein